MKFPKIKIGESADFCGFQVTRVSFALYTYSGNPRLKYRKAAIIANVDHRPINRRDVPLEKLERVVKTNPALPVSAEQHREFYLDWVNNFCSTEGCAAHYGITQDEAKAFIERGKRLHEQATLYTVVTVSTNTNTFGYKSVLVLREDGTCYKLLVQAYGTDEVPEEGDKVDLKEPRFYGITKLPSITPEKAAKIIKTLTKSEK